MLRHTNTIVKTTPNVTQVITPGKNTDIHVQEGICQDENSTREYITEDQTDQSIHKT